LQFDELPASYEQRATRAAGNGPRAMRFIHFYLAGYFLLVMGAGMALWRAGALLRISPVWLLLITVIVIGLGLLLAATSNRTRVSRD
jgi:hypothetical protein